ncbi:MAG TPA: PQQ-binding-like beta-propeller repeat protein [Candidatus Acidoferrales bacterium]|nr:PQQ-binding-like beta-propeller repeat protein [Candidatus Acidoferrales bacterium]
MKIPARKPLRLWPGVVIVILLWLIRFGLPVVPPEILDLGIVNTTFYAVLAGPVGGVAIAVWWLFFSRAAWSERLGAVALMIVGLFVTKRIVHVSIATGGQGMLLPLLAIPILSSALVVWAVATRRLPDGVRRATMVATILLACGGWALVRTGGFTASNFHNDLHWRWAKTPEERLLAKSGNELRALPPVRAAAEIPAEPPMAPSGSEPRALPPVRAAAEAREKRLVTKSGSEPAAFPSAPAEVETGASWPGFRGPHRDDNVPGVRIKTDWTASPPVALWRRPVGPGWSSFAVRGGLIYTQEQRGPDEVVACYKLTTGEPVWAHRDSARFWESNGGPGPRATPTLNNGRVYAFGATGILNALNARDGAVVWSRNAASDTGTKVPTWGFASSPLVVGDIVIVAVAGELAAYDLGTGARRWFGPAGGASYSSPHRLTIDGVTQILLLSGVGVTSVALADGKPLWEHAWKGYPIVQPALTANGDVLISVSDNSGIRRLAVVHDPGGWRVEERWTSIGLKPYFNDFVVHKGHAFGFDGSILACIDLEDGKRKWKGGRYGNGQLVLLPDQDLLLVVSEEGELALVQATPDQFTELARFPAIEGKTWNHPVLAGDVLLVRNGEEMAAFRLSLAGR